MAELMYILGENKISLPNPFSKALGPKRNSLYKRSQDPVMMVELIG